MKPGFCAASGSARKTVVGRHSQPSDREFLLHRVYGDFFLYYQVMTRRGLTIVRLQVQVQYSPIRVVSRLEVFEWTFIHSNGSLGKASEHMPEEFFWEVLPAGRHSVDFFSKNEAILTSDIRDSCSCKA